MCKAMEDMCNNAVWYEKVESTLRWLEIGATEEMIAKGNGLTVEQVKEIASQRSA